MKIGLMGLGAMGRVHFDCWRRSTIARLTAIAARDQRKLDGWWAGQDFNLGAQGAERVETSDLHRHLRYEDLIADADVQLVDICLPTPLHAPLAIAALRAGKHVFCEKPMALALDECAAMEAAAREAGRQLMIGHCLRYWPHYVKAQEILRGGEYGRALYARFHRSSAMPAWSAGGWLKEAAQSGGVLDLHIHDIDVALWWFGQPATIAATGLARDGLACVMDAAWGYEDGLTVQLHGAWDRHGGTFRHAFTLVMEEATLSYDLALAEAALQLHHGGTTTIIPLEATDAYQAELDDFAACCAAGRASSRVTPAESRLAVAIGLEELGQLSG